MKILIAGATGFIGTQLITQLLETTDHDIIAISRREAESNHPRLKVVKSDLYSLLDIERAMEGCDIGIYLVHSMSPSSRLSQGSFRDFDFLLADNFAKAASKNNVSKIIYVGGIIPAVPRLSEHLLSRLEVEKTLQASGVTTISLRCGLIIGPQGSSFRIVEKLVERLPLILMPKWTYNKTQAIYVKDVIEVIKNVIQSKTANSGSYEIGAIEKTTYSDLLIRVAKAKKTKNIFIPLPSIPMFLSKPWVSLVTGTAYDLVSPLIDSLKHDMLVHNEFRLPDSIAVPLTPLDEAIRLSLNEQPPRLPVTFESTVERTSVVQSVQRLPLPASMSVENVAALYTNWLQKFLWPFLRVVDEGKDHRIYLGFFKKPLLVLEYSESRTFQSRPLYYIRGGFLAKPNKKARMEFRKSSQASFFIVAIHEYAPRLPWYIYRYSQAMLHAFVMKSFGKYLMRKK